MRALTGTARRERFAACDGAANAPISGATISFSGGSTITNNSGF